MSHSLSRDNFPGKQAIVHALALADGVLADLVPSEVGSRPRM